jgi:hypothetical protein
MFRPAALTLTFLFASALTVSAFPTDTAVNTTAPIATAIARAATEAAPVVSLWTISQAPKRPVLLPALYGTYAVLQAMDVMSTKKALAAGGHEANPVMRGGNTATTIAIKAASGAATVYFVERAWKKNRVGGIVLMAAINGATAAIVAHNNHIASRR